MYERPRGFSITGPLNSLVLKHTEEHEIHVLLVDRDMKSLISTAEMLESCSYKVTTTQLASDALEMLSNGQKFDIVMANINSPDKQAFNLLQEAVHMEIIVVLIAEKEDALMAERALENGALHFLKKPPPMEVLKYLWQHVERERIQRNKEKGKLAEKENDHHGKWAVKEEIPDINESVEIDIEKNHDKGKSKEISEKSTAKELENTAAAERRDRKVNGKVCLTWTSELHGKFMDAVNQLGEGKCYPADIFEIMKVPGLTRLQVASHLQKCRNKLWRGPEDPKRVHPPPTIDDYFPKPKVARRYGSMPHPNICNGSSSEPDNLGFSNPSSNGDKVIKEYLFI